MHDYEPKLHPVKILSLHPTQITVGMREVRTKRDEWKKIPKHQRAEFLGNHMVPVVLGPQDRPYVIDHHHLVRALYEKRVSKILTSVIANLSHLGESEFWRVLDHRNWVYPYDEAGERRDYAHIPKTIKDMKDDPYRSLAGALRHAGGFSKQSTPYSEFQWADYLRSRIDSSMIEASFDKAVKQALSLAHTHEANYLPGWCGISKE